MLWSKGGTAASRGVATKKLAPINIQNVAIARVFILDLMRRSSRTRQNRCPSKRLISSSWTEIIRQSPEGYNSLVMHFGELAPSAHGTAAQGSAKGCGF